MSPTRQRHAIVAPQSDDATHCLKNRQTPFQAYQSWHITDDDVAKIKKVKVAHTERRVPELIPVLRSQPAGDVSHKPGVTFRQACSYPRNP